MRSPVRTALGLPAADVPNGYWAAIHLAADRLKSDGCTGVAEFYREACLEHDVHCRTGQTIYGVAITRAQADAVFRERIQELSPLGIFSPMAWWRWAGVRIGAAWAKWRNRGKEGH